MTNKPTIILEHGIPLPPIKTRDEIYPFSQMNVGDSFLFPQDVSRARASSVAGLAGNRLGMKFATRTCPDGVRCWRVAPEPVATEITNDNVSAEQLQKAG
jgi:hypothetical protein